MDRKDSRIKREKKTIETMIKLYCQNHHRNGSVLCPECQELLDYSLGRIDRCPFLREKTTCANCKIHCYKPTFRDKIRGVMRFSGPRMTYRHPVLALFHFIDGFKKAPPLGAKK